MTDTGEHATIEFSKMHETFLHLPNCPPLDEEVLVSNQEILDVIDALQKKYESELRDTRSVVYNAEAAQHFILYSYPDGDELVDMADHPEVALLTLFEQLCVGQPELLHLQSVVSDFWERTKKDKKFDAMHARFETDFYSKLVLKSFMEEIAQLQPYERQSSINLHNHIKRLKAENAEIVERMGQGDISELEPNFMDDDDPKAQAFEEFINPKNTGEIEKPKRGRQYSKKTKVLAGVLAAGAALSFGGIASCSHISSSDDSTRSAIETLPTLTNELTTTTTVMETTTTLLQDCKNTWTVESGESLFSIAAECSISIESILAVNPIIVDPDKIAIGQVLQMPNAETQYTLPPTTTTLVPETTTTAVIVTVPPTEAPTTVATPPPAPEPAPPTTINTGVLSAAECTNKNGISYRAEFGDSLWKVTPKLYPQITAQNQIAAFVNSPLIIEYHLEQLTASTEGQVGAECFPNWDVVAPHIPAAK